MINSGKVLQSIDMLDNRIIVFFHVATIGNYQEVVDEIFNTIMNSELINNVDRIVVSIVGNQYVSFPDHDKIVKEHSFHIDKGEFVTLQRIKDLADESKSNLRILYIHTKGVTTPNNPCIVDWRQYMSHFNIVKSSDCIEKLKLYDTCGVDFVNDPAPHYSGNFWWANSDYIKILPDIEKISNEDAKAILTIRHNAEFWIGMVNGKHVSLHNTNINVYERHLHRYLKENYL